MPGWPAGHLEKLRMDSRQITTLRIGAACAECDASESRLAALDAEQDVMMWRELALAAIDQFARLTAQHRALVAQVRADRARPSRPSYAEAA